MERKKKIGLLFLVLAIAVPSISIYALSYNGGGNEEKCQYNSADIRPMYFDSCEFQINWLKDLPEMPEDFYEVTRLFSLGYVQFYPKSLNESYWKQPEWFPNLNMNLETITSYQEEVNRTGMERFPVFSTGVYPSEFYLETNKKGEVLTAYTWIKNTALQSKYEGVGLYETYPSYYEIKNPRGVPTKLLGILSQNSTYAKEHIKINMTPNEFLLSPAYPTLTYDYVKMIKLDITIDTETKPGIYMIGFFVDSPSREFSTKNYETYGFGYTDGIKEFHINPRRYTLIIEVV